MTKKLTGHIFCRLKYRVASFFAKIGIKCTGQRVRKLYCISLGGRGIIDKKIDWSNF